MIKATGTRSRSIFEIIPKRNSVMAFARIARRNSMAIFLKRRIFQERNEILLSRAQEQG